MRLTVVFPAFCGGMLAVRWFAQSIPTYVKTEEEELGMLVEESEGGQDIPTVKMYLSATVGYGGGLDGRAPRTTS